MQLIPNWKKALHMFSVQAQGLNLVGIAAWMALPDDMRAVVPPTVVLGLAMVLLVLGIVGRLIVQPGVSKDGS